MAAILLPAGLGVRRQKIEVRERPQRGVHDGADLATATLYDETGATVATGISGSQASSGTIALQAHDPDSRIYYRNLQLRVLSNSDDEK